MTELEEVGHSRLTTLTRMKARSKQMGKNTLRTVVVRTALLPQTGFPEYNGINLCTTPPNSYVKILTPW
jgi:hypothetical protein